MQSVVVGSEIRIFSAVECVSAVQGHPRSLILAPNERRMRLPSLLVFKNNNFGPIKWMTRKSQNIKCARPLGELST